MASSETQTVEICGSCGRPANPPGSYWFAPNDLWNEVNGSPNGFRCIPCFTADCRAKGISVAWTTTEEWRDTWLCKHCEGTGSLTDGITDCPRCAGRGATT